MPITTKTHNPGFLTDDELREMFCVRVAEFESLVETLRENTGESNQHVIVVGPRGSGKTTLLLRAALEVRSDPELSSRLHPIMFAEESYSVGTCGEFWLECLSLLSRQTLPREDEPDLRRTVRELRAERNDRLLRERCLGALLDFAEREDKRLVLGVENLNMLFDDMSDPDAGWCLRKTLQTEPRIMMIGSATSRFDEIDRPDRALYDLFRILSLRPLGRDESAMLCERVSRRPVASDAARRLEILTGGSPRLLTIMARFGAAKSFRALLSELIDLVDEHTPYFKSHLEHLSAQKRRVYLALASEWKPATAREVGERARMETSKTSAQLARLMRRGVVSQAGGTGRRRQYYVSERLYNIYYLLRRSRGADELVAALVRFMDAYYSPPELRGIVDAMVAELDDLDPPTRLMYEFAFKQFSKLPEVAWHVFQEHPDHVPAHVRTMAETVSALLERGGAKFERGDFEGALDVLNKLLQEFGSEAAPIVRDSVARARVNKGNILVQLERHEEAIHAFDEAADALQSTEAPELHSALAMVLVNRAACLNEVGRTEEAINGCDDVIDGFPTSGTDSVAEPVALALFNRGGILERMDQTEDALAAYDDLLRLFGSSESVAVLGKVAQGQVNKAVTLSALGRHDEALSVLDELWERFGQYASSSVLEPTGTAMTIKSAILSMEGRIPEHLSTCRELLDRLEQHERLAAAGDVADYEEDTVLSLRVTAREIRMLTYVKEENVSGIVDDVRAILGTLPRLGAIQRRTIKCLMAASLGVGIDRMASLIRESPSAELLLALTTALELEMGMEPRVAIEVQEVAADIRRNLATMREGLEVDGVHAN